MSTVTTIADEPFIPGATTCAVTEWCVSYHSSSLEPGVVTLHVHKSVDEPNQWGGRGVTVDHEHYGRRFPDSESAHRFAYDQGFIGHYWSERHPRSACAMP